MKAQIWYSQTGEERISPTKKAICTRSMKGSKMPVTTSWSR